MYLAHFIAVFIDPPLAFYVCVEAAGMHRGSRFEDFELAGNLRAMPQNVLHL